MGETSGRKFGLLQDIVLIVIAVSVLPQTILGDPTDCWLFCQNVSVYYLAKQIISSLPLSHDPEKEQHEQAQIKAAANLRRLNRQKNDSESDSEDATEGGKSRSMARRKEDLVLNQYENQIAMEVVAPEDIPVGFEGKSTKGLMDISTNWA
jgi:hypothetical protein